MAQEVTLLPRNIEAERTLLGKIFADPESIYEVAGDLQHFHFYDSRNDLIYQAMISLSDSNTHIDYGTLADKLKANTSLAMDEDMPFYISDLAGRELDSRGILDHKNIIIEKFRQRQTVAACHETIKKITEEGLSANVAQEGLLSLADKSDDSGFVSFEDGLAEALATIELVKEGGTIPGISTHYKDLDKLIGGVHKKKLTFIGGRPSMGKTSFAMNMAENIANDKPEGIDQVVAIFSFESSDEELAKRAIMQGKPIGDPSNYNEGEITDRAMEEFRKRKEFLDTLPIHIDETASNIRQISSRARRLKARKGLDVLIIDYLQLISGKKAENRNVEIGGYTRALKILAKELDIAIVCLSQLSRDVEKRPIKRPIMSDLRDSGSIEQDADIIIFLYRPEVYKVMSEQRGKTGEIRDNNGLAEVIVAKNKDGRIGTVEMTFIKEKFLFVDRANPDQVQEEEVFQTNYNDDNPF
jgi:replicative DNA helicase